MEAEARAALAREFGAAEVFFEHHLEMRYVGQRHNIKTPIDSLEGVEAIRGAFDRDYKRRYGHADAKTPAEIQGVHLSAFARQRRPDLAKLPRPAARSAPTTTRKVFFASAGGLVDATVYDRDALAPGFRANGPALIEEYGSTTLVWPQDCFEIGALREIRIAIAGG